MAHYVIKTSSAKMPGGVRHRYYHVAVLEVDGPDRVPTMISERARGVKRIVAAWWRCADGRTERCAYQRALAEARAMVQTLTVSA